MANNELIFEIPRLFHDLDTMIQKAAHVETDAIFIESVVDIYIKASDGLEKITTVVDKENEPVKDVYERLLSVKFKEFYDGMSNLIYERLNGNHELITSSF